MTSSGKRRYSKYIRPINIAFDVLVLTLLFPYFFWELGINQFYFGVYQLATWFIIAYIFGFYEIYRFTSLTEIIVKIVRQGIVFLLVVIAFFPFSKQAIFSGQAIAKYLVTVFIIIILFKFVLFYYLKRYRVVTGSNYRKAVIIGYTPDALRLKELFEQKGEYGYRFLGFFSDRNHNDEVKGKIAEVEAFAIDNNVDEIYCSLNEITNYQIKRLVEFADINDKVVKFIPDTKEIFTKNLRVDYYEFFPVLSLRKTPLHEPVAKVAKRLFDIAFSLFVIVFVLTWLTPILALIIKLESPGPVFFKQGRPGINEKEFFCYKFRSMKLNKTTEESVIKNDPRVTRIGRFMRKTSIDEMPQFLNVLIGEMSVVGPRPHLWSQNNLYSKRIKKYLIRLYVKPGITGLAQVKGYRGEISTDEDMINRIKYDVFYIENWSLLLDLKIIVQTVVNIFQGEEKAY